MTAFRLILRNLLYFRGVNIAVIAGVAVATAVLSGALMVGDSVRASLTDLAIRRLGKIDHALISSRYFEASLADRMLADPGIKGHFQISPAVIVRGGAGLDSGGARTAGVQIIGAGDDWAPVARGTAILNSQTADALGLATTPADIVLSVPTESDIPRDAPLAQRSRQDVMSGLRGRVSSIVSEPGMISLFTPDGGQRSPQNVWVNLPDLQNAVGRTGRINTLFVHDISAASESANKLNAALRRVITLADYGLDLAPITGSNEVALTSRTTYLGTPIELTADRILSESGIPSRQISVNLMNAVNRMSADGTITASIHYAVAAGITPIGETPLAAEEVALNQWAAERLGAKVGDLVTFTFYRRQMDGALAEVSNVDRGFFDHFRVARIMPMTGLGADPSLTPTYKGMTDSPSIASWNPPAEVKIDRSLVTDADEAYWKQHKAAPKIFFSLATANQLWGDALGSMTSIRLPANRADEFASKLLAAVDPASMGLYFRPLRQEQIAAAGGTTDFGQLFIGFSFFLIVAAALLVAMLLRLGVEQRSRQLGAMSAIGFSPAALRRIALSEGMILSLCGGIIGSFAAVGYTWLMMAGLRTWWIGAIGTTAMRLYVFPQTLILGFVISQIIALLAIVWAVRQIGRAAPARLLAGGWEATMTSRPESGRWMRASGAIGLAAGLCVIITGIIGAIGQQVAFLCGGTMLLASSLCLLGGLVRPRHRRAVVTSIPQLGMRNATRHPARSMLAIGLIALAAFALVTVSAMRQGEPSDTGDPRSGAGGYRLMVDAEIPLLGNPSTREGRALLGFRDPSNAIWDRVEFLPMRRRAGQDVSCLNLTKATSPTILGVPRSQIERGGFTSETNNPWKLLDVPDATDAIPVIADDSTAKYILHLSVGSSIEILDASGVPRQLRLAATLPHSIFQSQLLMSEDNFRKLFPSQSGFGIVLIKVNPDDQDQVRRLLSDELNEFAASIQTTASVLANYLEVQNTYLSTFELLGALGLMLGTVGLAVVLVRTIIERQAELALLTSLGFRTEARIRLVLAENVFLLVTGLVLGTICALIGVLPALSDSSRGINVTSLALTLAAALLFGLGASGVAVMIVGTRTSPAGLRKE